MVNTAKSSAQGLRVGMISLGCAKNLVDAEIMLGALAKAGMGITADPADADVVIVNTCSFIDSAQEESVDTILESAEVRDQVRPNQGLVVSGCLSQRFRDRLPELFPEVDAFMGIDQVTQVAAIVQDAHRRRQEGAAKEGSRGTGRKTRRKRAAAEVAALAEASPAGEEDGAQSLRGTDQFGKTRTVVAPGLAAPAAGPVLNVTQRPKFIPDYATPRFRLTPRHFAYVKIAEGCNHPCSFCTIPRMRGSHRSRPQSDVVEEARRLLGEGVKELNLISQDSTYYGLDLRPAGSRAIASPERFTAATRALPAAATTLGSLLRALDALPGDFWIRLLYTHPAHWTDELIEAIAECPRVARYVDMPLQHIHETMLQRMRRETSRGHIEGLIERMRSRLPGLALRTTFIVGFPGETESHFQALLDFIRAARFERLGVFTYSREESTVAGRMARQIPEAVREERRHLAMAAQHAISRELGAAQVGKALKVLVERPASDPETESAARSSSEHGLVREPDEHQAALRGRFMIARSEADAPDIDGRVYVKGRLRAGEFTRVKVVGFTDYDLMAEPA